MSSSARRVLAELLWAEKYRPRSLSEIVNQKEIVERLQQFVKEGNMPHLLFAGPPGTGKTTAAHALAHDLYGEDYRMYMLELNASVAKDTPILVKIDGRIRRVTFEELDKLYFNSKDVIKLGGGEYVKVDNLEVLSFDKEAGKVKWSKVSWLIRHKVGYVVKVKLEGGGEIKLTGNHSVIAIDDNANLVEKKASEIKPGDYLISFVTTLRGRERSIDLRDYIIRGSRVKVSRSLTVDEDTAWFFGLYVAEGALGFSRSVNDIETSGQVVITVNYPEETDLADRVGEVALKYGIPVYTNLTSSGFNRSRLSAVQIRLLSTALARYLKNEAYRVGGTTAKFKRVPSIIYELNKEGRVAFLKGVYEGDGSGEWGDVVRISSRSKDLLVDLAWLARITGIESSVYNDEVRLIWKGGMKYKKSDLLPVKPFVKFFEKISRAIDTNWRYVLRHQLYEGKETVSKDKLLQVLDAVDVSKLSREEYETYRRLRTLVDSDIHVVKIVHTEVMRYDDYVYDVSVPSSNLFFAGTIPILLHNSDERGIDVIRTKVKEFARSKLPVKIAFKIILLDEADNMTADAQQALRRLMEMYVDVTRFILIANYPSKIIEPIQSRCAVFRFTPLSKEDVISRLKWICNQEGVKCEDDALEVIYEISEGDMRKSINILQSSAALGVVNVANVYKVVGLAHPKEVREMIKTALAGNFLKARDLLRELMLNYGLSGVDIIKQIHREIFSTEIDLPEHVKVELADYVGEVQYRLVEGADDEIQLSALLARLALVGKTLKAGAKTVKARGL